MSRYSVETTSRFTPEGKLGVVLFLAGPAAAGIGSAWFYNQLFSFALWPQEFILPSVLTLAGSLSFLVGCVLILIGREQKHTVQPYRESPFGSEAPRWSSRQSQDI